MCARESLLRTQIITKSREEPELEATFFNPGRSCEELFSQLRAAVELYTIKKVRKQESQTQFQQQQVSKYQFFLDRKHNNNNKQPQFGRG